MFLCVLVFLALSCSFLAPNHTLPFHIPHLLAAVGVRGRGHWVDDVASAEDLFWAKERAVKKGQRTRQEKAVRRDSGEGQRKGSEKGQWKHDRNAVKIPGSTAERQRNRKAVKTGDIGSTAERQ